MEMKASASKNSMGIFREEFNRAFYNIYFLIALLAGIILLGIGLYEYTAPFGIFASNIPSEIHPSLINAYDAVIWSYEPALMIFAPLIAALPFSASYLFDRQTQYVHHILLRTSFWRYISTKAIVNALAGGLALALPFIGIFAFAYFFYFRGIPPLESSAIRLADGPWGPFSELYRSTPSLYLLTLFIRTFIFGAIYATVGLAISTITDNRYLVIVLPFVLYLLIEFILETLKLGAWGPLAALDPLANRLASTTTILTNLGFTFITSIVIFILRTKQDSHPQ